MDQGGGGKDTTVAGRVRARRVFLKGLYGATIGAFLAACGGTDADVFANVDDGTAVSTNDQATASTAEGSTERTLRVQTDEAATTTVTGTESVGSSSMVDGETPSTAENGSSSTESGGGTSSSTTEAPASPASSTTSTTTGSSGALPSGGTMVVAFTYEQGSGGKNVPPYIAVWVEDGSGALLTTISLWYQQFGRGERWLPDLARWYNVDQKRIAAGGSDTVDAISGATRSPGSYQVAWDGRAGGSTVGAGSYFVCIESARERGPYSLIRKSVNLNGGPQQIDLGSDGELVNASVAVNG